MTYEIYRAIFIGGLIFSIIMFLVSAVLFFVLKIPKVIGDLSGSTAKKAIQQIREQNEQTGVKTYKSSPVNRQRGRLTDKIGPSGVVETPYSASGAGMRTEKISTQMLDQQAMGQYPAAEETTLLSPEMEETTVLSNGPLFFSPEFKVEQDITLIHTEEYITE